MYSHIALFHISLWYSINFTTWQLRRHTQRYTHMHTTPWDTRNNYYKSTPVINLIKTFSRHFKQNTTLQTSHFNIFHNHIFFNIPLFQFLLLNSLGKFKKKTCMAKITNNIRYHTAIRNLKCFKLLIWTDFTLI